MPGREKNESHSAGLRLLQCTDKVQVIMWSEFFHCYLRFGCGVKFGGRRVGVVSVVPLKSV